MTQEANSKPWKKERSGKNEGDPPENEYPFEERIFTSGGVEINWGNQPGKQHVTIRHPKGTYMTIWPDGKMETYVRGEQRLYVKGGSTTTIDENSDTHVEGQSKTTHGGGVHIEVTGDAGIVCGGNVALAALSGNMGVQVKNLLVTSTGNVSFDVGGDTTFKTKGTTQFDSGQNHNTNAKNIASVAEEGTLINTSGGDTNVKASGDVVTKGATTKVQEGGAGAPPTTFT